MDIDDLIKERKIEKTFGTSYPGAPKLCKCGRKILADNVFNPNADDHTTEYEYASECRNCLTRRLKANGT